MNLNKNIRLISSLTMFTALKRRASKASASKQRQFFRSIYTN